MIEKKHTSLVFRYLLVAVLILMGAAMAFIALGQKSNDPAAHAVVSRIEGFVDILPAGEEAWIPLTTGDTILPGDTVETDPEGSVELTLPDNSVLLIGPSTSLTINEIGTVEATRLTTNSFQLLEGKIRAIVPRLMEGRTRFIIETENASVGVRGTDFYESFDPDTLTTSVVGLDGCVFMTPAGGAPFNVCAREEASVLPGVIPTGSSPADDEMIRGILKDMPLGDGRTPDGPDDVILPEITGAVLSGGIDLDFFDDEISLIRDDLTTDGAVRIEGAAGGGSFPLDRVEVSTDGGFTWDRATGADRWTFEFKPAHDGDYEILFRAIDAAGNAGDPMDFGPFYISYRDIDAETLAREVLDRFFFAVRIGDGSELDDIISDEYNGIIADLFDKNELTDKMLEDHEAWPSLDFSYSINRIDSDTGTIIIATHWDILLPGGIETGTTRWWLDAEDAYRIVHAEGDWISDISPDSGELILELQSAALPCSDWVLLMVAAPNIPEDIKTITVAVETNCGSYIKELARPLYQERTGKTDGFAVEFPVATSAGCVVAPLCPLPETVRYITGPAGILDATYTDFGYDLSGSISLP
jgi:hypothetical protein